MNFFKFGFLKGVKLSLEVVLKVFKRYLQKIFLKPQIPIVVGSEVIGKRFPTFSQFKRRHILGLLTLFLLLFSVWYFKVEFLPRGTISQGVVGVYDREGLNTSSGQNLPQVVATLLSEPLVIMDETNKPQPKLTTGWQVNNDASFYTFKLKNNLSWNDGTKVKASDIKFNLPDVEINYPDDSTIEFKLPDSFSAFPSLLTNPIFKENSLIGVGRYKVLEAHYNKDLITKLVLQLKNTPENVDLPKVIIRFYPDEKLLITAFSLGEVDSIFLSSDHPEFKEQTIIKISKLANFSKIVGIFYNTKDPILGGFSDGKNFRKALNSAILPIPEEVRAKTSFPPASWAYNSELKDLLGSTPSAKAYFDKVQNGKEANITLTTTGNLAKLGEEIIKAWKVIGINAILRVESGVPQNFQAVLTSQTLPPDPDQYSLWHSSQIKTNLSKYDSKRADKDLEDGRKLSDLEKRKEKYLDLQKVLADDIPATFLYFPQTYIVYRKKFEDNLQKVLKLQMP